MQSPPGGVGGGLPLRPTSIYGGVGVIGETPTQIAQQQLKFVEQLLKETKGGFLEFPSSLVVVNMVFKFVRGTKL